MSNAIQALEGLPRTSLSILGAALIALSLGVALGALSARRAGFYDDLLRRLVEFSGALPLIVAIPLLGRVWPMALGTAVEARRVHGVPGRSQTVDDRLPDPTALIGTVNQHERPHFPSQVAERGPSASLAPSSARSPYSKYGSRAAIGRRLASGPLSATWTGQMRKGRRGDPQCTRWGVSAILGGRGGPMAFARPKVITKRRGT